MEKALQETVAYTSERKAFGKTLLEMQNTRFKLAEVKTIAHIARVFVDDCVARHVRGSWMPSPLPWRNGGAHKCSARR
ncbi:MAG: acyl-CoA dehydrogenase family protein [Thiolinea sp.]